MTGDLILKEDIHNYKCTNAAEDRSAYWYRELAYAVRLGNEFKGKTTISFNTTEGIKTVETTVWSLTENYLQLKGGISIPLNSIVEIHF
jgi:hypothetical protein